MLDLSSNLLANSGPVPLILITKASFSIVNSIASSSIVKSNLNLIFFIDDNTNKNC